MHQIFQEQLINLNIHAVMDISLSIMGNVFSDNDPYGFMMAILGMGIVFTALLLLFVVFTNTPRFFTTSFKKKMKAFFTFRKKVPEEVSFEAHPEEEPLEDLTGEVNAAIAAAIHLYRSELHDYEDTVLTIKKVSRTYSPWSSKIYGMQNLFNN